MMDPPSSQDIEFLIGDAAFAALAAAKKASAVKKATEKKKNDQKRKRAALEAKVFHKDEELLRVKREQARAKRRRVEDRKQQKYEAPPNSLLGRSSTLRSGFYKEQAPIQPYADAKADLPAYIALVGSLLHCMYCGTDVTFDPLGHKGDHFYSSIENKRPRGYCNDLFNRVPCCAKCNSSKASKLATYFMLYTERLHALPGYEERLERVKQFAFRGEPYRLRYDVTSPVMLELFETLEQLNFFTRTSLEVQKDVAAQLREINQDVPHASEERSTRVQNVIAYVRQLF